MGEAMPSWVVTVIEGAAVLILALLLYLYARRSER